jgi:aminoglycoside phosphotransferase (APT) family kinase protein
MVAPGRLIASGRDADIFELGPDHVLRRTRAGRSLETEARAMAYAYERGFPLPKVHEVRTAGTELVMERIRGPIMADAILRRIWTFRRAARTLADLHDQLHAISGPNWLPQIQDGGAQLVHLDLHPLNIIIEPERGPVVIDWANASRGEGLTDVALTYVLLTCPRMPGSPLLNAAARPLRQMLAGQFTKRYRGAALDARIADAAVVKAEDPNMQPDEITAMHRLATRMRRPRRGRRKAVG